MKAKGGNVFICAGEHSGDLLAADLVTALRQFDVPWRFFGVCGQAMLDAGVRPIASLERLSVMGIWEVAAKLADICMLEREVLAEIDRCAPVAAILVDFPGFHFHLAEQLRLRGIRVYQYIAPKVWAWGAGRIPRLQRDFRHVLGVFPFEVEFFAKHGVPYTYVGSPHLDRCSKVRVQRADLGLALAKAAGGEPAPLFAFLPGSRLSEIKSLLPAFMAIKSGLKQRFPHAQFVIPVAPNIGREQMAALLAPFEEAQQSSDFILLAGMSLEVMAVADACCVASGTATLECALVGTPMAVVYQMSEISYALAKRKVKLPAVSLVNILLGRTVVSEFIQNFSCPSVVDELVALALPGARRTQVLAAYGELKEMLSGDAAPQAARVITADLTNGEK